MKRTAAIALLCALTIAGCGGHSPSGSPTFTLAAAPEALMLTVDGAGQQLTVTAAGQNGFSEPVQVSLSGLPAGVVASPSAVSLNPGQLAQITLTASDGAAAGPGTLTVKGSASAVTSTVAVGVVVNTAPPPVTTAALSTSSFSFGDDLLGTTLTKPVVTIQNTGDAALTMSPKVTGDGSFSLAPGGGCGSRVAPGTSCVVTMAYTPTTASGATPQNAVLDLGFGNVPAGAPHTVAVSGTAAAPPRGNVTATNNPQVALYTMALPFPGTMTVNFGQDSSYGVSTWSKKTVRTGQAVSLFVAGMLGNSTYHMQASVRYDNGLTSTDVDHVFNTGPPMVQPQLSVTTTPGKTPQRGVEELTGVTGSALGLSVTDLQGNVLWSYALHSQTPTVSVQGAKLLPNGDFLLSFGNNSSLGLTGPPAAGTNVAIREVTLAGDIVREISLLDLNAELATAGYGFSLLTFHHDVTPLPNGHWLVLANTSRDFTDLPGYPGVTTVLGDVIVDLDANLQPVWVWNEFDHFDVNRHPFNFPDWTHTNAVVYSKDDGNLLVSMRHQNWVVKVDYKDGTGTGDVLWRLGEGGDFKLAGGNGPDGLAICSASAKLCEQEYERSIFVGVDGQRR